MNEGEEVSQKSYYAVIPANVRYDATLTANAKLLYGEITALANHKGYCFASNSYFAQLYDVTPQAISKWVNLLADRGYISISLIHKENAITERRIFIGSKTTEEVQVKNKRVPLIEREPVNPIEQVEKEYLLNYKHLYECGIVKLEKPVINWTASRKLTKDCIEKYGLQTIVDAVKKSRDNKFCVSKGYVLTTILSAGVLSQLINTTDGRIDNDSVVGDIDF